MTDSARVRLKDLEWDARVTQNLLDLHRTAVTHKILRLPYTKEDILMSKDAIDLDKKLKTLKANIRKIKYNI